VCLPPTGGLVACDGRDPVEERTEKERLAILNAARATVEEALQLIASGELRASKRTRLNLIAERASIYGYLAVQRGRSADSEALWSDYLAAKAASAIAVALSDDYHPIDIALWTSSDVLRGANLSDQRHAEVFADLNFGGSGGQPREAIFGPVTAPSIGC
jgi:hypothetical protein